MATATAKITVPSVDPIRAKFAATRDELRASLIERDDEIDLFLTAIVAGEHALIVGPPGCAKSALMDAVVGWLDGPTFSALLHRSIPVDELMGAISVKTLRERDIYERNPSGRFPEAELACLDEIFKASPVALSPLLRVLNERVFERGGIWVKSPLRSCLAGSNEWPSSDNSGIDTSALFDRFIFRKTVRPVATAAGKNRLKWARLTSGRDLTPRLSTRITAAEIDDARAAALALPYSEEAMQASDEIDSRLKKEGIIVGDRRTVKAVAAAQAYAWLDGADEVRPEHLEVLCWVLWDDPAQQEKAAKVIMAIANPVGMQLNSLLIEVESIVSSHDIRDISQASAATKKLQEISGKLLTLPREPRVQKAINHVNAEIKRIRLASV